MKHILILLFLFSSILTIHAQSSDKKIYDPTIDVHVQVKAAIAQAKVDKKHVLLQIGGNWCPWCIKFHRYIDKYPPLKNIVSKDYVYVLLNIDKTHPQTKMLEELNYPQRFGFPVFVILDDNGYQLHIQDSALLEDGKSYNFNKVKSFLNQWNFEALSPKSYKK